MTLLQPIVKKAVEGVDLSPEDIGSAVTEILSGTAPEGQVAAFLTATTMRGYDASMIAAAAAVLRCIGLRIDAPDNAMDCCGTGGDGAHTYNISTAVALVLAGCGVPVAKHGNRAASSRSGAADVLESLGVDLSLPAEVQEQALRDLNFCFLMAPRYQAALAHVGPLRKQLGFRTIFNLLGPLANPAGTRRQLIGVYDPALLEPVAAALQILGTDRAWVVCGAGNLDEITLAGDTAVAALENGTIRTFRLTPSEFGLGHVPLDGIRGGDASQNARALMALLNGESGPYRDVVLANTAAALVVHGAAETLPAGVVIARAALDDGRALQVLESYKALRS